MPAIAPQLSFDLRISERRPLAPLKVAMWALDRNEDDVLALIGSRALPWAFDLARAGAERQFVAVWNGSIVAYKQNRVAAPEFASLTMDDVLADILPDRQALRAVELKALLASVVQGHIAHLIADKLIAPDARRNCGLGRGQSPWVTRASVAGFLQSRLIVASRTSA